MVNFLIGIAIVDGIALAFLLGNEIARRILD